MLRDILLTVPQANQGPVIHMVHVCEDINAVILRLFCHLSDTLQGYGKVELWVGEDGDWHMVSTASCIAINEDSDTLLVKIPGIITPMGLGRELEALRKGRPRIPHFGQVWSPATVEVRSYFVRLLSADLLCRKCTL